MGCHTQPAIESHLLSFFGFVGASIIAMTSPFQVDLALRRLISLRVPKDCAARVCSIVLAGVMLYWGVASGLSSFCLVLGHT